MKKERFYYAVASFMDKDGKITVTSVAVRSSEEDSEFYPLMATIKRVEETFPDTAIFGTIVVNSTMEISKEDYDAFQEHMNKLKEEEKEG